MFLAKINLYDKMCDYKIYCELIMGKIIKSVFVTLFIVLLIGCNKDEIDYTGDLEVQFVNNSGNYSKVNPNVYFIEYLEVPLFMNIEISSKGYMSAKNINFGNYILEYHKEIGVNSYSVVKKPFQISVGETTRLEVSLEW